MKYLAKLLLKENTLRSFTGRWLTTAFVLLAPTLTASCSYQALFESIQQNHLERCETTPIAQQAACEAHYQTSYEEYQREREALLQENVPN